MQKRKFDELISHFNRKVADMSIDQKYKMELLGMISAIRFAHEKELTTLPDNGLQKLADEIAKFKRHLKSENSDYLTGYLCALSVVEGMIADMREVTT